MTTKITHAVPNSAGLPIDPRTQKPFKSIGALAAFEHGQRLHGAVALAEYHLRNLKEQRR